jgi:predicted DNA-binding transcriptional regulator AlpA
MRALSSVPHRVVVSDDARYVAISQLCERFQCSRIWIERRLRDNDFPRPVQFGGKTSARRWVLSQAVALKRSRARVNGSKQ